MPARKQAKRSATPAAESPCEMPPVDRLRRVTSPAASRPTPNSTPRDTLNAGVTQPRSNDSLTRNAPARARAIEPIHTGSRAPSFSSRLLAGGRGGGGADRGAARGASGGGGGGGWIGIGGDGGNGNGGGGGGGKAGGCAGSGGNVSGIISLETAGFAAISAGRGSRACTRCSRRTTKPRSRSTSTRSASDPFLTSFERRNAETARTADPPTTTKAAVPEEQSMLGGV